MATDELLKDDAINSTAPRLKRSKTSARWHRILGAEVGFISRKELKRRMWHMLPGLLPIISWIVPHKDPLSPTFKLIAAGVMAGLCFALFRSFHTIVRKGERNPTSAVFGYAGAVLATLLLFPAQAELGMTVLVVLAFGDGSATLGGMLFPGPRLPWNADKTWSGLLCFLFIGAPLASLAYWAEAQPYATFDIAAICGCSAIVTAAIAESIKSQINDNIRVGVVAAAAVAVTHGLVVGFA